MAKETVNSKLFKKQLDLDGVASMQDAINVLALFQSWRTGETVRSLDELGLRPDLITAAIHYILAKYKAQQPMFKCATCAHNLSDLTCLLKSDAPCVYRKESN